MNCVLKGYVSVILNIEFVISRRCSRYFPASPPVSCYAFDVDQHFKYFVPTDV